MITWLVVAALSLVDPSGDTHGAGDLAPPTAAVYSSLGSLDLTEVRVLQGDPLRVRIGLASLDNPAGLPNGVTVPIVEVYLDVEEGGEEALLPGSDLRMPAGDGWEIALRVTGDEAFAVRAESGERMRHPVRVEPVDDGLVVVTPFAAPERARLHAITGVYDPFAETGWRPLARQPSPWSFSSPVAAPPVVDVLAPDGPAQRLAVRNRELPTPPRGMAGAPWVVLMVVGVVVAGVGVGLRRAAPEAEPEKEAETDAEAEPEPAEAEPAEAEAEPEPAEADAHAAPPPADADADIEADPGAAVAAAHAVPAVPAQGVSRAALDWSEERGWILEDPDEPDEEPAEGARDDGAGGPRADDDEAQASWPDEGEENDEAWWEDPVADPKRGGSG